MLDSQLAHVLMMRGLDSGRMRHPQRRPHLLQQANREVDALLFGGGKAVPPRLELIGEFDSPRQALLCHIRHLCRQRHKEIVVDTERKEEGSGAGALQGH